MDAEIPASAVPGLLAEREASLEAGMAEVVPEGQGGAVAGPVAAPPPCPPLTPEVMELTLQCGVNPLLVLFEVDPLDEEERECGGHVLAVALNEYWQWFQVHNPGLIPMTFWMASVSAKRYKAAKAKAKAKAEALKAGAAP